MTKLELDGWTYIYKGPETGFVRYKTTNKYTEAAEKARKANLAEIEDSRLPVPTGGNDSY